MWRQISKYAICFFRYLASKRFRRLVLRTLLILIVLALLSPFMLGINPFARIPPQSLQNPRQAMRVYDMHGNLAATRSGVEARIAVGLSTLPPHVPQTFICAEDTRFYRHFGLDLWRIGGAMWHNLKRGSVSEGASTITQQLVKNSMLTQQKSIIRKMREAILAMVLERQYSKDEILEMYLNNAVYFGRNAYSIESAAQVWFGVSASQLTLAQSALLAAIMPNPSAYSPATHPDRAKARRNRVLDTMLAKKYIGQQEHLLAVSQPVTVNPYNPAGESYGYYIDEALREAMGILNISAEEILSGGYNLYTALDLYKQQFLEQQLWADSSYPKEDNARAIQCAGVLCNPQTGGVVAMVGGRDYTVQRGLNRATQIQRQPGSAIKPILVFAPAIEYNDYCAANFVLDEPGDFAGYMPNNPGGVTYGWVTLRQAVEKSYNLPAVRVLADVGIGTGRLYASRVGVPFAPDDDHLALALGGFETGLSPMQLCGSYLPFANGGRYIAPWMILRITDDTGRVVFQRDTGGETVLSAQTAYMMTDLLSGVTGPGGTGRIFAQMGAAAAGKTGTVDIKGLGNRDAWMVAYSQSLCGVVWMGYDTMKLLPGSVVGGTNPAHVLANIFLRWPDDILPPAPPPGLIRHALDAEALAGLKWEIYDDADIKGDGNPDVPAPEVVWEYFREADLTRGNE